MISRKLCFLNAILTLVAAMAFAGQEVGNGGDGVILQNDRIVLFDAFERGVDADQIQKVTEDSNFSGRPQEAFRRHVQHVINNSVWEVLEQEEGANPGITKDISDALFWSLYKTYLLAPTFGADIAAELKKLHWQKYSDQLLPNSDTQPFIKLPTGVQRVGCVRNINNRLLYSAECFGPRMSAANQAALILHEAIYSMYRKDHPTSENSFPVRTVVAAIFDPELHLSRAPEFSSLLKDSGFEKYAVETDIIRRDFFRSHVYPPQSGYHCYFPKAAAYGVTELNLGLETPVGVSGSIENSRKNESWPVVTEEINSSPTHGWFGDIPRYDIANRKLLIHFSSGLSTMAFPDPNHYHFTLAINVDKLSAEMILDYRNTYKGIVHGLKLKGRCDPPEIP